MCVYMYVIICVSVHTSACRGQGTISGVIPPAPCNFLALVCVCVSVCARVHAGCAFIHVFIHAQARVQCIPQLLSAIHLLRKSQAHQFIQVSHLVSPRSACISPFHPNPSDGLTHACPCASFPCRCCSSSKSIESLPCATHTTLILCLR